MNLGHFTTLKNVEWPDDSKMVAKWRGEIEMGRNDWLPLELETLRWYQQ